MKKCVYLVVILLLFCTNVSFANSNQACTNGSRLLVLQVLDNGVLGHICPSMFWNIVKEDPYFQTSCRIHGRLVFLFPDNNYVDDQLIKISRKECFAEVGTFQYTNKKDDRKTVRAVKIINK